MTKASTHDGLVRALAPVLARAGLDLEGVEVTPAGKRRLLRVVVDRDGGVSLDDVAAVSSAVSATLDSSAAMGGLPYVLEISSPGVDRPLIEPRHWRRARGRLVTASLTAGGEVTGRVASVGDAGVDLDTAGTLRAYAWGELSRGRIQVEFNRQDTVGHAGGSDAEAADAEGSDEDEEA